MQQNQHTISLFKMYPYSLIKTYGEHVGLPNGQMGNSEVGHMSIGSWKSFIPRFSKSKYCYKRRYTKR